MRSISAAVAAIALIAGAAHAQGQGQGNGKNNERGGGKPEAAQGGGNGGGNAERGNRGQDGQGGPSMAQPVRASAQRGNGNGNGNGNAQRVERGNGNGNGNAQRVERGNGNGNGNGNNTVVVDRRDNDRGTVVRVRDFASISPRGLIDGCPPGLAKKRNGCQPPGQARQNDRFGLDRPDFWGLRLGDGRYSYRDGHLLRFGTDGQLGGYIPLLGGALSIGNAWPDYYEPFAMPGYYEQYYGLGDYNSYRYADRAIYRVDPDTSAISSIAALLTGDQFAIGQPMPRGYDVYNVPYGYRDRYSDGPDDYYRYSDGYVYQVDPTTQLISAAIELLAS